MALVVAPLLVYACLLSMNVRSNEAVEGTQCSKKTVPYRLRNLQGSLYLECKAWDCVSGRQEVEAARLSSGLVPFSVKAAATSKILCVNVEYVKTMPCLERLDGSGLITNDCYQVKCCNYSLASESTDPKMNASLTPGSLWEAQITEDTHGRRYVTVPYVIDRIGSTTSYSVALRQIRCRPPPPADNQINPNQLPNRGGFNRMDVQYKDNKGVQQTVPIAYGTCFSADTTVLTPHGVRRMDQLKLGDYVLSVAHGATLNFKRVSFFLHRDATLEATFIVLHTSRGALSLTAKHLIYRFPCDRFALWQFNFNSDSQLSFAEDVRVGDCVALAHEGRVGLERILAVTRRRLPGVFAPVTDNGVILVNNFVVSCYSNIRDATLAASWYSNVVEMMELLRAWLHIPMRWLHFLYEPDADADRVDLLPMTTFSLSHLPVISPDSTNAHDTIWTHSETVLEFRKAETVGREFEL